MLNKQIFMPNKIHEKNLIWMRWDKDGFPLTKMKWKLLYGILVLQKPQMGDQFSQNRLLVMPISLWNCQKRYLFLQKFHFEDMKLTADRYLRRFKKNETCIQPPDKIFLQLYSRRPAFNRLKSPVVEGLPWSKGLHSKDKVSFWQGILHTVWSTDGYIYVVCCCWPEIKK